MTVKKFNCLAIASPSFSKHAVLVAEAKQLCENLLVNDAGTNWTEGSLVDWLNQSGAEAVIIGTDPFSSKVVDGLKYIQAVGKYGVGCDNVAIEALQSRGIYFGWEGGVNRRGVSELVLSYMLGHFRNVFKSIDKMQNSNWEKNGGVQLSNRTVGIVGLGFIGTDLACLLKTFGCTVLYFDIVDKTAVANELGFQKTSYEELIQKCDVISFHVPGDKTTQKMFGLRELKMSKNNLLVINTARASVVDFDAVSEAVLSKKIAGFASDVFSTEPFVQNKYLVKDGFYFTPHIGGNAEESVLNMGRSAIRGLRKFLDN